MRLSSPVLGRICVPEENRRILRREMSVGDRSDGPRTPADEGQTGDAFDYADLITSVIDGWLTMQIRRWDNDRAARQARSNLDDTPRLRQSTVLSRHRSPLCNYFANERNLVKHIKSRRSRKNRWVIREILLTWESYDGDWSIMPANDEARTQ